MYDLCENLGQIKKKMQEKQGCGEYVVVYLEIEVILVPFQSFICMIKWERW